MLYRRVVLFDSSGLAARSSSHNVHFVICHALQSYHFLSNFANFYHCARAHRLNSANMGTKVKPFAVIE